MRILESENLIRIARGARGGARVLRPDPQVASRYFGVLLQARGVTIGDIYRTRRIIEPPAAEEDEPLTLDAPMEEVAQADELLLDAPEPEPEPLIDEDLTAKRGWFGGRAEPEAAPAPAPRQGGGTLFERMSSIARGNAKAPGTDDDGDPLDIPRFLNRQNNQ